MQDVRIAVVQMTCRVGEAEGNIARMAEFLSEAAADRVDLVCFPELSVQGYTAGDPAASTPEPIPGPSTEALVGSYRKTHVPTKEIGTWKVCPHLHLPSGEQASGDRGQR